MSDEHGANRREFLEQLALVTGATVLVPAVTACEPKPAEPASRRTAPTGSGTGPRSAPRRRAAADPLAVPKTPPAGWDDMAFNLARGKAGAIPAGYLMQIEAPGGDHKHLGKHLPYVPKVDAKLIPGGYLAVMYGDASKGNARHPADAADPAKQFKGHWFNWIKIRKAVDGAAQELKNEYPDWPGRTDAERKELYAVFGGGDIKADSGKNTIFLVKLPADVKSGDTVRIWGHCLLHGEYVDFLTV